MRTTARRCWHAYRRERCHGWTNDSGASTSYDDATREPGTGETKDRTVRVVLSGEPGGLAFRIVDDGLGFDPRHADGGRGLANVRDRIEALGGTVEVRSVPGEGATVSARLPAQPLVAER
jgi:signal transduction histidine kinase